MVDATTIDPFEARRAQKPSGPGADPFAARAVTLSPFQSRAIPVRAFPSTKPRASGGVPAPVAPPSLLNRAGDVVADIGEGIMEAPGQVLGGVRDAVQEMNESAFSLAGWLNENVADLGQLDFSNGIQWKPGMPAKAPELPEVDDAESTTGNLVRGVSQFLTAFIPAAKAMKVGGAATKLGQFGRASAAGAVADATAFDPHEKRLANLIESHPALSNPVTAYLAADPSDTEVEGRFKNAVEGLGLGTAAEGFLQAIRAIRASRRAGASPDAQTGIPGGDGAPDAVPARPDAADVGVDPFEARAITPDDAAQGIAPAKGPKPGAEDAMAAHLRTRTDEQVRTLQTANLDMTERALVDAEAARRGIVPPPAREAYPKPAQSSPVKAEAYPSQTVTNVNGKTIRWSRPLDMVSYLRSKGGLQDQAGELSAMGLNNAARRSEFTANEQMLGPLVADNGMTLDDAARTAWEAGFIDGADRPDVNQFLDVLRRTHEADDVGARAFRPDDRDWLASRNAERPIEQEAAAMGIDDAGRSLADLEQEVGLAATLREDRGALPRQEVEASAPLQGDVMSREGTEALDAMTARGKVEDAAAGNIRLDGIETVEDIRKVLKTVSDQNAAFGGARRGVVSDDAVQALADDLGMTAEKLGKRRMGQAFNAEEALASRQLLANSGEDLVTKAKAARGGGDAAKLDFMRAWTRHVAVQEQVAGMTAEAGRALRSFQLVAKSERAKLAAIREAVNRAGGSEHLDDLADKLANIEDPATLNRLTRQAYKPGIHDMLREYWINSLLSGPNTHVVNMTSNALVHLWSLPEDLIAAGFGKLHGGEKMFASEAGVRAFSTVEGVRDGFKAFATAMKEGRGFDNTYGKLEGNHQNAIPGVIGDVVRIPTRMLEAEDSFFKMLTFRTEINALAVRDAKSQGLTGADFAKRVGELKANPSDEMVDAAIQRARENTFTNSLGKAGNALSLARQHVPGAGWVVPFLKTPLNILKFAARRTPVGIALKEVRDELAAGGIPRDKVLAQMSLGSAAALASVSYAMEGKMTGGGPSDFKEKRALMATGWRPYSVKIGDEWVTYNRLDPIGMLMGMAADVAEILKNDDKQEATEIVAALGGSFTKLMLDKSYLRGIADAVQAADDPDRHAERWVNGFITSFIPNAVGQVTRADDPILRETKGLIETFKAKLPGMSRGLFPKRNMWGEPIARDPGAMGGGMTGRLLSPAKSTGSERDALTEDLIKLDLAFSAPSKTLRGVELTPAQYDRWSAMRGGVLRQVLSRLHDTPTIKAMPDFLRREIYAKAINKVRSAATSAFLAANPEISTLSINERAKALTEGRKREKVER